MQRVRFPAGGTHLSLTAGRSRKGSASGLARGPCRARCPLLGAQRCRPAARGVRKRRLPSQRTAGARWVRGSPRPDGGAGPVSRGRRGEAITPRGRPRGLGPRAGGWRAPVCRPARDRKKHRAARPRWSEEAGHILGIAGKRGLRGAPALGGAWRDTRAHAWCGAAGQGKGCRHCRSSASNSSSPPCSPVLRGGPRPSWGHPRPHRGGAGQQERTLPRREDRSYSSPGRLGSWSAGETP